jgi:hypothetical protein
MKPTIIRCVDKHFGGLPTTSEDIELGGSLAYHIGDTFIDCKKQTPDEQWIIIVKALRIHGLIIIEKI